MGNLGLDQMTEAQDDKEITSNAADDQLDLALTDIESIAMADGNVTLTTTPDGGQALANMYFRFTGANTAVRTVFVPDSGIKLYIIENATTGGFGIDVERTSGGASVTVGSGNITTVYNDGSDVVAVGGVIASLNDVGDVNVPSPADGEVLTWDGGGGEWVASPSAGGSFAPAGVSQGPVAFSVTATADGTSTLLTVSNIPQNADHLLIIGQVRSEVAAIVVQGNFQFNGDTGANYDASFFEVHPASTAITGTSGDGRAQTNLKGPNLAGASSPAGSATSFSAHMPNYSSTTWQKFMTGESMIVEDVAADSEVNIQTWGGRWRDTSAITSISLQSNSGDVVIGSTLTVIGLRADSLGSFNSGGNAVSRALYSLSADQTANLALDDHIEFDTVEDESADMELETGAGQLDGIINLPPGKLFLLEAGMGALFTGTTGDLNFQWRNNTDTTLIGTVGEARAGTDANDTAYQNTAQATISTFDGAKEVEVRIIASPTALTHIESTGAYIRILEIPQNREAPYLGAKASLTADETRTDAGGAVEIPWDQIEEELGDWDSLSTSTDWVVPAGVERVQVIAQVKWEGVLGGERRIEVFINGAATSPRVHAIEEIDEAGTAADFIQRLVSEPLDVVAGDTISIDSETVGVDCDILGTTDETYFAVHAVKGVGESRVESVDGFILGNITVRQYTLVQDAKFAFRIDEITTQLDTGTDITWDVEINGTDVTGLAGQVSTTTEATDTATALNTVAVGDRIRLNVTAITATPADLGYSMKITRT